MPIFLCLIAIADEPFRVTLRRDSDRVTITLAKDQSPFGISDAKIERRGERRPKRVVLQLQLKGLESFQVSNGETNVAAAVSSSDGAVRVWKNDREDSPLKADDPYRPKIRRIDDVFEITLPAAFFERNPQAFTVRWIDFYR